MSPMQRALTVLRHTIPREHDCFMAVGLWMDSLGLGVAENRRIFARTWAMTGRADCDVPLLVATVAADWQRHIVPELPDDEHMLGVIITDILEEMAQIAIKRTDLFHLETPTHVAHH